MHLGLVKKNKGLMQYITKDEIISKDPHPHFDCADSKDHFVLYVTKDYNKCTIYHKQQFDSTDPRCKTKGSTKKNSKNPKQLVTNCRYSFTSLEDPLYIWCTIEYSSTRTFARYGEGTEYGPFNYNIDDLDDKTDNHDKSSTKNFNNPKIMAAIEERRSSRNLNSDKLIADFKELFNTSNLYAIEKIITACNNADKQLNSHLRCWKSCSIFIFSDFTRVDKYLLPDLLFPEAYKKLAKKK
ncbi:hypothetical protein F8M41_026159 [Gigaspora margarita]|uniref:Uncharacterized protein n=1 Tax=Gigaspora margarita TaxID=4874 RepID=A0A8H3XIZ0_GIGMA|nr:hypothetical protein F8M41_026159 [Gigaspora margarita]